MAMFTRACKYAGNQKTRLRIGADAIALSTDSRCTLQKDLKDQPSPLYIRNIDTYTYTYSNTHPDSDTYADAYTYRYANSYADSNTYAGASNGDMGRHVGMVRTGIERMPL